MAHRRTLSLLSLVMINLATLGYIRYWPLTAEYGLASGTLLVLSVLLFLIPTALISAELASAYPRDGGVFLWVKEAFGHRLGFLAIWLQWAQNVVWYPSVLTFVTATFAYAINPQLAENKVYTLIVVLVLYWAITLVNLRGVQVTGWICTAGTILGAFLPALLLIAIGVSWLASGNPAQVPTNASDLFPSKISFSEFTFFTGIVTSLMGIEMSAVHARDVYNPQKNYPRAILLTLVIFLAVTIPGVLSIAFVVPQKEISLLAGGMQAFSRVVDSLHLAWMTPILAILICFGQIASITSWLVGPVRGLLAAAQAGDLPPALRTYNKHEMPVGLLMLQGVVVSLTLILFILMPLDAAFWFVTAALAQIYLVMYLLVFAAAVKLRYKRKALARPFKVPGKNFGMWTVCIVGVLTSIFTMFVGFFPPAQMLVANATEHVILLASLVILFIAGPFIILLFKKPSWTRAK